MRVYQALPRFDDRSRFTTWMFQIAKHRVVDELRARERRPRTPMQLEALPQLRLAVQPAESVEEMDALWRAIGGLPLDLRMALVLRDVVGLSYAEIADALETTLATVKWRIYKAREGVIAELDLGNAERTGRSARRVPSRRGSFAASIACCVALMS